MRAAASIGNAARQMMDGSVVPYAGEEALYPVFINEVRLAETASGWFGRAHGLARLLPSTQAHAAAAYACTGMRVECPARCGLPGCVRANPTTPP